MRKPIVVLDLETTGTDICRDRVVQISTWKLDSDFKEIEPIKLRLVNPLMPIPAEATAVHKITNEMVANEPQFVNLAKSMFNHLSGCDIAGFNSIKFDIPMLSEEFARCNIDWPAEGTNFFDACRIFHQKEPRDLTGAVKFYLNTTHEGAHDAREDVIKTAQVLGQQLMTYGDLAALTAEELSEYCRGKGAVDFAGNIVLNDAGVAVYSFGKDKGKSVKDNPGFGQWMLGQSFPANTKKIVRQLIGK